MTRYYANNTIIDIDRDGIADATENALGLPEPSQFQTGVQDSDNDEVPDYIEVFQGSDPNNDGDSWPRSGGSSFTTSGNRTPQAFDQSDFVSLGNGQVRLYLRKANGSNAYGAPLERGNSSDFDWFLTVGAGGSAPSRIVVLVDAMVFAGNYPTHYETAAGGEYVFQVVYPDAGSSFARKNRKPTFFESVRADTPTRNGSNSIAVNMATGREEIGIEIGPNKGVGKIRITQNNNKISIWDAETGGNALTTPFSQSRVWTIGDPALTSLLAGQRLWIEGLSNSDEVGDTELLIELLDEDNSLVRELKSLELTVLSLNLTGHLPGNGGAAISEADEDEADNLFLMANDDFDERLDQPDYLTPAMFPIKIFNGLDDDYMELKLSFDTDLSDGELRLQLGAKGSSVFTDLGTYFNVVSEDRADFLTGNDLELNLNNAQGPLASLANGGEVTLLIEGRDRGIANRVLRLQYTVDGLTVVDDVHLHLVDVDFEEVLPHTGFDDNDDQINDPRHPALMIPLAADGSSGANQMRVVVTPSIFREDIELVVDDTSRATAPSAIPASGIVVVTGLQPRSTEIAAIFAGQSGNAEAARIYIDVKPRLTNARSVKAFDLRLPGEPAPQGPSQSTIQDFLDDTWGLQANVYNRVNRVAGVVEVDYDVNNDNAMEASPGSSVGDELDVVIQNVPAADADINIFYVDQIVRDGRDVNGFHTRDPATQKSYAFVEAERRIDTTAHEYGHALGLNSIDGEGHSETRTDVMGIPTPTSPLREQIRRYDWNIVNPTPGN